MIPLWTFETREKADAFLPVLQNNNINYETDGKKLPDSKHVGVTVLVEDKDYAKAKRLLMKHRKRRTSADLN